MSRSLTSRQETFCRHFCATGNAAEAARRAGYAVASARQTGHDLLNRPWIIERVRDIREAWRQTARREVSILLARLEQAWDVAVAADEGRGSAPQMLQVIRLQAEIAGLTRHNADARADLWSPADDGDGDASDDDAPAAAMAEAPLTAAVRTGREAAERALSSLRQARRWEQGRSPAQQAADYLAERDLARAIDARRALLRPIPQRNSLTNPDSSDTLSAFDPERIGTAEPTPADDAAIDAAEAAELAGNLADSTNSRASGEGFGL